MVIFYVAIGLTGLMIVPMLPDLAANLLITLAPGQTLKLAPKSFVYAFTSPASVGFIFDRLRNCRPDPVPPPSSFIKPHAPSFNLMFLYKNPCSFMLFDPMLVTSRLRCSLMRCRRWCSLFVTAFMKLAMIALVRCVRTRHSPRVSPLCIPGSHVPYVSRAALSLLCESAPLLHDSVEHKQVCARLRNAFKTISFFKSISLPELCHLMNRAGSLPPFWEHTC